MQNQRKQIFLDASASNSALAFEDDTRMSAGDCFTTPLKYV